jgi:hypothetical protein
MPSFASYRTWTEADIAALSARDIAQLNYDEMLELISAVQRAPNQAGRPKVTESEILVRQVYALRQRCRRKLAYDSV